MTNGSLLARIDDLQCRYVRALDTKNLNAWLELFDPDGQYFVIPSENEASGLPMGLMMDDCHERLVDRVSYVMRVWTFDDYQMRHFVQRLQVEPAEDDLHRVDSNFTVFCTTADGRTSILAAGRYEDHVRIHGEERAAFRKKRVILDNFVLPMNIVYPL